MNRQSIGRLRIGEQHGHILRTTSFLPVAGRLFYHLEREISIECAKFFGGPTFEDTWALFCESRDFQAGQI